MKRVLAWLLAASVPLALALALGRSACVELRLGHASSSGNQSSVYDPLSYFDLVNREIAPHLELCPLFPDPSTTSRGDPPSFARPLRRAPRGSCRSTRILRSFRT